MEALPAIAFNLFPNLVKRCMFSSFTILLHCALSHLNAAKLHAMHFCSRIQRAVPKTWGTGLLTNP